VGESVAQFSFSKFVLGNPPLYKFSAPVELTTFVEEPLFLDLIRTEAFQRLGSVRFLGGIDYLLVRNPNGAPGNTRYTRLQHSLGVARLALEYSSVFELPTVDRQLIVAAALLHDVGHAPLSHSIEPVFRECFAIDHHDATKDVIFGHVGIGRSVYKVLRNGSIDIDRLAALVAGKDTDFHAFFSGPINFDTIEGILRTRTFGKAPGTFAPDVVVDAAINRSSSTHREIVDQFWLYKDQVYRHVINSSLGILADQACQAFARGNLKNLEAADYLTDEDALFRKLPGLRQLLTSPDFASDVTKYLPEKIHYTERRFRVDRTADFSSREDRKRYLQFRSPTTLNLKGHHDKTMIARTNGDLFSDESD
jgi:putative nucleotidyltransferase with HDIG domain